MQKAARKRAQQLFERAFRLQMSGSVEQAVLVYRLSIEAFPTAEAHTYLGWAYRYQGKLDEAIEECRKAIALDPEFGNPYNDIGVYLMEQGKADEAIPYLEKATQSERYEPRHYPWYNLGRLYADKEWYSLARQCFSKSLELEPEYKLAQEGLVRVRKLIQ